MATPWLLDITLIEPLTLPNECGHRVPFIARLFRTHARL